MDEQRPMAELEAEVRDLRALLGAALERIEELDGRLAGRDSASGVPPASTAPAEGRPIGRRGALKGAALAAGAAAAGLVLGDARPAAADNGGALVLGSYANTATQPTGIIVGGTSATYGFGIMDTTYVNPNRSSILAHAANKNFDAAIEARAEGSAAALVARAAGGAAIFASTTGYTHCVTATNSYLHGIRAEAGGDGDALQGSAPGAGAGVYASSKSGRGVVGSSTSAIGVEGTTVGTQSSKGVRGAATAGTGVYAESASGFGAEAYSTAGTGLKARGKVFGVIAQSLSTSPTDAALAASSLSAMGIFVASDDGLVMSGSSATNGGIEVKAPKFHVRMGNADPRGAPTADTFAHQAGEIVYTTAGETWFCVKGGTPGTWRKVAGQTTAGAFHVLAAPVRVYDSRTGSNPSQGPKTKLSGNVARPIDCTVNSSGVPKGATAVSVTVLLINASTAGGNMTAWANGVARPSSNTMVWGGSAGRFTASTICALDASGKIQIAASASTDVVLDIVGYYR